MIQYERQNIWFNKPVLENESVLYETPANHEQKKIARGGKIFATEKRLIFIPNRLDALLGGKPLEMEIANIHEITIKHATFTFRELFSGALRKRLHVRTTLNENHFFVVDGLESVIKSLGSLLNLNALEIDNANQYQ